MPLTPSIVGGWNPTQAVGLARSSALSRILHFENTLHRRLGTVRPQRYLRLNNYYTGLNLPPDNVEQPLGINFFKSICDKHVSYLWGQWQSSGKVVTFRVRPNDGESPEDETGRAIRVHIERMLKQNDGDVLLRDGALNGSMYGDTIYRLRWDAVRRHVVIENILPEFFHCRWNVTNMNQLTEVIVSYPIDRLDAMETYGTAGNTAVDYNLINPEYLPGFGIYWEHWTPSSYRIWIDDYLVQELPNPYMRVTEDGEQLPGIIPFVHIPNMRVGGDFWGYSDGENILYLQDEINRRMADMGDAVNNHAHPIITLKHFQGEAEDLPVGPDAVWNLGREGVAEYLQWKGTPPAVIEYIEQCKQMMYDTANMPEVAFGRGLKGSGTGRSSGGSSGLALQIALMPMVERSNDKRVFWDRGIRHLVDMALFVHAIHDPASLPFDYHTFRTQYDLRVQFAQVLPRDRMQQVNENVALVNTLIRSTTRALDDLGEENIMDEYKAIQKDARFKAQLNMMGKPMQPGGKNSDRGQGGSPGTGGPGASNTKPGAPMKDAGAPGSSQ